MNHHNPVSDVDDFDFPPNSMGGLIERFEQDHALRISSPSENTRRYSEGYSLIAKVRKCQFEKGFYFRKRKKVDYALLYGKRPGVCMLIFEGKSQGYCKAG